MILICWKSIFKDEKLELLNLFSNHTNGFNIIQKPKIFICSLHMQITVGSDGKCHFEMGLLDVTKLDSFFLSTETHQIILILINFFKTGTANIFLDLEKYHTKE